MTAPDLTLRVVMVSSDITDDIDAGLELNAEPTVILQGSMEAVKAAAKLFGEQVAITRAFAALPAVTQPAPDAAAIREALQGMLSHSCVADAGADMKDPQDHEAERKARAILALLTEKPVTEYERKVAQMREDFPNGI